MVTNKIELMPQRQPECHIYIWSDLFRDVILFDNQVVTSPPVCRRHDFLSDLECTL